MANPDDKGFENVGFDISHNNGALDFARLHNEGGRRACFLKITEGTTYKDPKFVAYVQELIDLNLGFRLACYHFAHGDDPRGQVDHWLSTFVEAMAKLSYEPEFLFMIDAERGNNPPTRDTVVEMVAEMAARGIPNPMVYCGYDFFQNKEPSLAPCSHMVAAYNSRAISAVPWRRPDAVFGWDWWQYTGDSLGPWARDLSGGSHGMDLSCFNGVKSPAGFDAWWAAELAKQVQPS